MRTTNKNKDSKCFHKNGMRHIHAVIAGMVMMLASCSTTKHIPDNDRLFIGLKTIQYDNYEKGAHFDETKEEVEAALATAPNGALFGSSYYRTPFPYGLWIWNAFSGSDGKVAKWITKTFGKAPVLMSQVNPELRASVAKSVMRNHGYFHANVDYSIIPQKNPKKAKISYNIKANQLFTIDTVQYVNFPDVADSLIRVTEDKRLIHQNDPFDVASLDAERIRITNLFRDNGYYYYQSGYASYLADTIAVPGKVQLRLQMANGIPDNAKHKWYIGNIKINFMKQFMENLKDSFSHRHFTVRFNGRRPPIRPRIILRDLKLRPRQMYSYSKYLESANKINGSGLFNMVQFGFTPRDTTAACDTLDLTLTCVFNKPYDFYIETNYINKVNGRTGPQLVMGLTKYNAFRGGEKLDINLHGSYEWQTSNDINNVSSGMNSYEYGADASIEFPRLIVPFLRRRRFHTTPSTVVKASLNVLNRPDYFKMHTASGEWTYRWQRKANKMHELSPLTLTYQYMNYKTERFNEIMNENPYLYTTMQDVLIPKIRYTYKYTSPQTYRNPITWETTASEAGNILSLGYMVAGHKWSEKEKQMFKNAYAQFFKVETSFSKIWQLGNKSQFVGHVGAGVIYSYGNSDTSPYSEQFYVGGANSIRAFTVRSIGPGSYKADNSRLSYLDQTGDIKLQMNMEYRFNIFGSLYGATFLDAGNVWSIRDDGYRKGAQFKLKNALKEMAVGTGVGIRYDLEFLVIRLDWGLGLHVPYETDKGGFYNIPNFHDGQSLHFAVGYPF